MERKGSVFKIIKLTLGFLKPIHFLLLNLQYSPLSLYICYIIMLIVIDFFDNLRKFLALASEPTRFSDAVSNPKWRAAMKHKYALEQNGTWKLTSFPLASGLSRVNRCTRLSIKQIEPLKYSKPSWLYLEIHNRSGLISLKLVEKMVNVRTLLSITAAQNWPIHKMDVHNVFLHSDLTKRCTCIPLPDFILHISCMSVI